MNHADRKIVAAVTLVLLLLASIVRGEDWKTTDGTTYQNVTVIHHDSTVVTVSYNNSTAPIASSDLSKAIFRGLIGTVTLPLSSLDKVIQQTVLNDHTTVVKNNTIAPSLIFVLNRLRCGQDRQKLYGPTICTSRLLVIHGTNWRQG